MKHILYFILILTISFCSCAIDKSSIPLTQQGKTNYSIVIPTLASASEKQAAKQLKNYLDKISTANFPVISEETIKSNQAQKFIYIGKTRFAATHVNKKDKAINNDGIVIKTVQGNLMLTGNGSRSALYAVYHLLEEYLNCRWWTPTESSIPLNKNISLNEINMTYSPPFSYRSHFSFNSLSDPEFATTLNENGDHIPLDENWGNKVQILGWVHTFSAILPPETYFNSHPEWYSDPGNSHKPSTKKSARPSPQATQLCMSNLDMQAVFLQNTLKWIDKNPTYEIVSISQNDNRDYCHCNNCLDIIRQEGSPSGLLLRFVNKIAAGVQKRHPKKKIETLAYLFSERPPKITKPNDNVIMRFAPLDADFGYPINSSNNESVRSNLVQWSKISRSNFFWGYNTNFNSLLMPHPSLYHLQDDLKFLLRNNFTGIFIQDNTNPEGYGYFTAMQSWVIGHLLWNPDLNYSDLVHQFMTGYYGSAGPYMEQYFLLMQEAFLNKNTQLQAFNTDFSFITLGIMNKGAELFQDALKEVKNDKVLADRVKKEKISLDYVWLKLHNSLNSQIINSKVSSLGPKDYTQSVNDFFTSLDKLSVKDDNVRTSLTAYRKILAADLKMDFKKSLLSKTPSGNFTVQEDVFELYKIGEISELINDANASDQRTALIHGWSNAWAVKVNIKGIDEKLVNKRWSIIPSIRITLNNNYISKGSIVSFGVYDVLNNKALYTKDINVAQLKNSNYKSFELNDVKLNNNCIIWFSVNAKNEEVASLLIDKVEFKVIN